MIPKVEEKKVEKKVEEKKEEKKVEKKEEKKKEIPVVEFSGNGPPPPVIIFN